MKRYLPPLWVVITFILVIGFFSLFTIEKNENPEYKWTANAKQNNYLVAGRLLEKMGYPIQLSNHYQLPSENGILWLPTLIHQVPPTATNELRAWIYRGNHLITTVDRPEQPSTLINPLLDELGIETQRLKLMNAHEEWLQLPYRHEQVNVRFGSYGLGLAHPDQADAIFADRLGVRAVRYPLGKGSITVIVNHHLFDNDQIDEADHATLLVHLLPDYDSADEDNDKQKIWLVYADYPPAEGLWPILWRYGQPFIVSLVLALFCWLWWVSRRFGPLHPAYQPQRRQLREHLQACGRYLWAQGQTQRLYESLRREVRQKHWPQHIDNAQLLVADLAKRSGIAEAQIHQALLLPATHNNLLRFIIDMRTLNQLRSLR